MSSKGQYKDYVTKLKKGLESAKKQIDGLNEQNAKLFTECERGIKYIQEWKRLYEEQVELREKLERARNKVKLIWFIWGIAAGTAFWLLLELLSR